MNEDQIRAAIALAEFGFNLYNTIRERLRAEGVTEEQWDEAKRQNAQVSVYNFLDIGGSGFQKPPEA